MRIMNMKRAMILLLTIGIIVVVSGCARWPEPEPEPPEPEYQLEITVEVAGEINPEEGIYYIVLDTDEDSADGPGDDLFFWDDDFYYIKLDNWGFYFAQVKDDSESSFEEGNIIGNIFQVTIALSDLGDPNSIDINVITTDSDNNTYDYLDPYFTISTDLGSSKNITDTEGDSGDGADFDIVKVTAVVTTLY
ncbi:MAG: hypothetical protein KAW42_00150 [Candidatus Atribacteria bacterium]|nr:hypothetical protein [Candidatus Atribacteria bacterium]